MEQRTTIINFLFHMEGRIGYQNDANTYIIHTENRYVNIVYIKDSSCEVIC